ncbi:MAG: hypothetical protein M1168_00820 [Candidatus Marsarchaeota archaeon]|nr:hypothetical protein [Candidatus Marsarchaeota archaeon]MCL5094513.1 hypothetical protein [Candidatus Marsarchaeota archaeon]
MQHYKKINDKNSEIIISINSKLKDFHKKEGNVEKLVEIEKPYVFIIDFDTWIKYFSKYGNKDIKDIPKKDIRCFIRHQNKNNGVGGFIEDSANIKNEIYIDKKSIIVGDSLISGNGTTYIRGKSKISFSYINNDGIIEIADSIILNSDLFINIENKNLNNEFQIKNKFIFDEYLKISQNAPTELHIDKKYLARRDCF